MPAFGNSDASVNPQISRYDFAAILATARIRAVIRPTRIAYDANNTTGYVAGTVLAQYSSAAGASSGLFTKYVNSGASGTGTAVAVLLVDVVPASGDSVLAQSAFNGVVFYNKLPNIDANAVTNLNGRSYTDSFGTKLLSF